MAGASATVMQRILILAVVVCATPALAQPAPAESASFDKELDGLFATGGLTADQAATRAVGTSPAVRKRSAEIDAAIAQLHVAELLRIPRTGFTATYTRLSPLDPIAIAPPPAPPFAFAENSYAGQASVAIALSDYVLRFPKVIGAARLGAETARIGRRTAEVDAGQDARVTYYEWVRARLQVLIARRQLAQVTATLGQVRALADAQRVSRADLLRVESQQASAEQVVDQLQNLAVLREEQLRLLIGAAVGEPLAIGEDIRQDVVAPPAVPLDDALVTATAQRLEFRGLDTGIRAKQAQQDAERASYYPRLSAFASADYARPNQRIFPQEDVFNLTWQAGVQLSWTLNDSLVARGTDRRYDAEIRALRADRENLERGTRIAILAAQQAVAIAQRALETSRKGLAAAEEAHRVRQALLAAQRATAVELVDAETELTRARIAALNARVDLRVALTQLAHAVGQDVR
jgi:outer membrane protein TolC